MGIAAKPLESLPETEQSFIVMLDRYRRHIAIVLAIAIVALAGVWWYARSSAIREERATEAFRQAMQSVFAGNAPLAITDLQKVAVRYDGTVAGAEAVLQLAQQQFNAGKFKEGIAALNAAKPPKDFAYDLHMLIGAGYEGLNQGVEAAKAYEAAAGDALVDGDRDVARSNAARAYNMAGKTAEAVKIWDDLASNPQSSLASEARVRLGEATAKPIAP